MKLRGLLKQESGNGLRLDWHSQEERWSIWPRMAGRESSFLQQTKRYFWRLTSIRWPETMEISLHFPSHLINSNDAIGINVYLCYHAGHMFRDNFWRHFQEFRRIFHIVQKAMRITGHTWIMILASSKPLIPGISMSKKSKCTSFFFKKKTAYEIIVWLEFRRVLFRSFI